MEKKKSKIISLILVIITILTAISPIFQSIAATYVVEYRGIVTYGQSMVRKFFYKWAKSILYGS